MDLCSKFLPACQNSVKLKIIHFDGKFGMREGMILCSKFLPGWQQGRNSIPSRLLKFSSNQSVEHDFYGKTTFFRQINLKKILYELISRKIFEKDSIY